MAKHILLKLSLLIFTLCVFLSAPSSAQASIVQSGDNYTDDFDDGVSSWTHGSAVQSETFACGSSCNSVKLSTTTNDPVNGSIFHEFRVKGGAEYIVKVRAGVYQDGAGKDGKVILIADNQTMECSNLTCPSLGSSIGDKFLIIGIIPTGNTLRVTIAGDQGGCIDTRDSNPDGFGSGCHDTAVDDFSLTMTAPPATSGSNSSSCLTPSGSSGFSINGGGALYPDTEYPVSISMKNTGTNGWNSAGVNPYKLGAQNPQDSAFWGKVDNNNNYLGSSNKGNRPAPRLNLSAAVPENSFASFDLRTTTPNEAGTYRLSYQMVQDGGAGWFGAICSPNIINVSTAGSGNTPSAECLANKTSTAIGEQVIWTARADGGTRPYTTFAWAGSDDLNSKTGTPVTVSYTTSGVKIGSVIVTDSAGQSSPPTDCSTTVNVTSSADLITQSLAVSSATPLAGSTISFSGVVKNSGTGSALASFSRFCVDNTNCMGTTTGRVGTTDVSVPALSGSETSPIIGSGSWAATYGRHTLYFCTDPAGTIDESNEANNCTSLVFNVVAPDLVVDTLSPSGAVINQPVTFSARVVNQGGGPAGRSTAKLSYASVANGPIDTTAAAKPTINNLSTGASETVTWTSGWRPPAAGNYSYEICADEGLILEEYNTTNNAESNNCLSRTLTVSSTSQPDLTASIDPALGIITGTPFTFTGITKNIGAAPAGVSKSHFCVGIDTSTTANNCANGTNKHGLDLDNALLTAGSTSVNTASATWTPTVDGTYTAALCVDAIAGEIDNNNNCSSTTFTVADSNIILLSATASNTASCNSPYVVLNWTSNGLQNPLYQVWRDGNRLASLDTRQTTTTDDVNLTAGQTYNYEIRFGNTQSNPASALPAACPVAGGNCPWIKTTGGDVHANQGITTCQ